MLADRFTKALREVDVCIEWRQASRNHVVSIECIDHRRRANIKWIDEMSGKHARLPTTELVLASRRGFSSRAQAAAAALGIQTIHLEDRGGSVTFPLSATGEIWEGKVSATPQCVVAVLTPLGDAAGPEFVKLEPDFGLYFEDGQVAGAAIVYVRSAVSSEHVLCKPEIGVQHTKFRVAIRPVEWSPGCPLFLLRHEPRILRPIEALVVAGSLNVPPRSRVQLNGAKVDGLEVIWGVSQALAGDLIVATTDTLGTQRISFGLEFANARRNRIAGRR